MVTVALKGCDQSLIGQLVAVLACLKFSHATQGRHIRGDRHTWPTVIFSLEPFFNGFERDAQTLIFCAETWSMICCCASLSGTSIPWNNPSLESV